MPGFVKPRVASRRYPARAGAVWLAVLLAGWLLAIPFDARAERAEITIDGTPPWKIVANLITGEQRDGIFIAEGGVQMTHGAEVIEADRVRYHDETRVVEVSGNVMFSTPDVKVVCERFIFNLDHSIGKFYGAKVFFPEKHYYLSGDEIEKTGPDTFYILKGRATSCDGPTPAWTLTGQEMTVEQEGYATAQHATLSTKYFPILYTPWIKIPVKQFRQSGLLMPDMQDSQRDGLTFTQPYYWAISDSKDMTFYLTYMAYRGLETTTEFRYNDWGGKGTYRLTYLKDQDPPTIDLPEPYGPRVQDERYWLRGMSNMNTDSGFLIKLDVDYVSDPEYLYEFERSITGFQRTNRQFLQEFGRDFPEPLDPLRKNTLLVQKAVDRQRFYFTLDYTDNLEDPDNLATIQRLPKITLVYPRTAIPGSPLFFSNNAEYIYFSRKTGETGHRLDVNPKVYWPLTMSTWLDLEPSVGFRETIYYPHDTTDPDRSGLFNTRELFEASLEASTNISRIFDIGDGKIQKIKHRIKPEMTFSFISDRYQRDLPYFDSTDRINEKQTIKYGLVNYLVAKIRREKQQKQRRTPLPQPGLDDAPPVELERLSLPEGEGEYEYAEFLRLGVFRTYDFVEERREATGSDFNRPNGPWEVELELDFSPYFWMQMTSEYDTYVERFTDHYLEFSSQDDRGDYFYVSYDLHLEPYLTTNREDYEYEEIRYLLNLALNDAWSVQYDRRFSLMDEEEIETFYSLIYRQQCWGLRLEYMDRPDDRAVAVVFTLLGIGEVGSFSYSPASSSAVSQDGGN